MVERQAEHFSRLGISGVFVTGSTGEGPSLTIDERQRLTQRWIEIGPRAGLDVLVQVGTSSVAQSKALAAHAQQIGAAAIGCLPPFYLKPDSADALVAYCAAVASAAPDLPFYYYHIPRLSGVDLPMPEFLEKGGKKIPNLAGMKFTYQDMGQAMRCLGLDDGRYNILLGWDEGFLAGLGIGIRGAIGNTFNFAAPLYRRVREFFEAGNLQAARDEQRRALAMIATIWRYGHMVTVSKAVMSLIGIDCGPPRLPLVPLGDNALASLRDDLDKLGFFQWAANSR
jgi:N-acetylneuraminate lyase